MLETESYLKRKEMEINLHLEKLKKEQGVPTSKQSPSNTNTRPAKSDPNFKKLIPEFYPSQMNISLYLVLFERQVKRVRTVQENWSSHLIGLLLIDVVSNIAREPEEVAKNFAHIKQTRLKRYKLNAENYRPKICTAPKATWKDFVFELWNYLNEAC